MPSIEERVTRLEENVKRLEGIENRLNSLERSFWIAFGAFCGVQFLISFFRP